MSEVRYWLDWKPGPPTGKISGKRPGDRLTEEALVSFVSARPRPFSRIAQAPSAQISSFSQVGSLTELTKGQQTISIEPGFDGSEPNCGSLGLPVSPDRLKDIELALKICVHLETLPIHQSVTASEIAEAFHGPDYALDHVIEVCRVCEQLREARIVMRGLDGYGYQLGVKANGS